MQKQMEKAILDFSQALDVTVDAQKAPLFMERAICHDMLDKNQEACNDYTKFFEYAKLATDKKLVTTFQEYQAYHNRGLALVQLKDTDAALKDFAGAIDRAQVMAKDDKERTASVFCESYFQRAKCYEQKKQYQQAVQDYQNTLLWNEKHSRAHYQLAYLFYDLKKLDEALQQFDIVVASDAKDYVTLFNRGLCHKALQNWDKAAEDFAKTCKVQANYYKAAIQLARANRKRQEKNSNLNTEAFNKEIIDQYTQAIDYITKNNVADQELAMLYFERAILYNILKNHDAAIKDFTACTNLRDDFTDAFFNRAMIYKTMKNYDLALKDLTMVLKANPNDADTLAERGIMYHDLDKFDEAIKDLKKALQINPNMKVAKKALDACQDLVGKQSSKDDKKKLDDEQAKRAQELAMLEQERQKKQRDLDEQRKKQQAEAQAQYDLEIAAKKKQDDEAAVKKKADEEVQKRIELLLEQKKIDDEIAAKKKADDEQQRLAKQRAEDAAKKQLELELAAKKKADDLAAKLLSDELAAKKKADELAKKRADEEELAKQKAVEEAAKIRAAEDLSRKQAQDAFAKQQADLELWKKEQEDILKQQHDALLKSKQEAALQQQLDEQKRVELEAKKQQEEQERIELLKKQIEQKLLADMEEKKKQEDVDKKRKEDEDKQRMDEMRKQMEQQIMAQIMEKQKRDEELKMQELELQKKALELKQQHDVEQKRKQEEQDALKKQEEEQKIKQRELELKQMELDLKKKEEEFKQLQEQMELKKKLQVEEQQELSKQMELKKNLMAEVKDSPVKQRKDSIKSASPTMQATSMNPADLHDDYYTVPLPAPSRRSSRKPSFLTLRRDSKALAPMKSAQQTKQRSYSVSKRPMDADTHLKASQEMFGFVPAFFVELSNTSSMTTALLLDGIKSNKKHNSLNLVERQVVQYLTSAFNNDMYSMRMHESFLKKQGLSKKEIEELHVGGTVSTEHAELAELVQITRIVLERKGELTYDEREYIDQAISHEKLYDIITTVQLKTAQNFVVNIAGGFELDKPFTV